MHRGRGKRIVPYTCLSVDAVSAAGFAPWWLRLTNASFFYSGVGATAESTVYEAWSTDTAYGLAWQGTAFDPINFDTWRWIVQQRVKSPLPGVQFSLTITGFLPGFIRCVIDLAECGSWWNGKLQPWGPWTAWGGAFTPALPLIETEWGDWHEKPI